VPIRNSAKSTELDSHAIVLLCLIAGLLWFKRQEAKFDTSFLFYSVVDIEFQSPAVHLLHNSRIDEILHVELADHSFSVGAVIETVPSATPLLSVLSAVRVGPIYTWNPLLRANEKLCA
jgi:hypothetical protein